MEMVIGRRVMVRAENGALFGGILQGWTRAGKLLVRVDETCLSGDLVDGRTVLHKPELRKITGEIVADPRKGNGAREE